MTPGDTAADHAAHGPVRPVTVRVARPVRDLAVTAAFYLDGLGLPRLGGFTDHDGFDGVFIGLGDGGCHLELIRHASGDPVPCPTAEDLLVLYLPGPDDVAALGDRLRGYGHQPVGSPNPYWERTGALVFADPDGYRVVLATRSSSPA